MFAALGILDTGLVIAGAIIFLIVAAFISIAWCENARWLIRLMDWAALSALALGVLGLIASAVLGIDLYLVHSHPFSPLVLFFPFCSIFVILLSSDYLGIED